MPAVHRARLSTFTRIIHPRSPTHIIQPQHTSQGIRHLDISQPLTNATARADRERTERALCQGDLVLRERRLCPIRQLPRDPALWAVAERIRVVSRVVVDRVVRNADDHAGRDALAVNGDAAWEDLAREDAADGGGQAHGFIDTGAQVGAGGELRRLVDVFKVCEFGADFLGDELEGVRMPGKVEEGCGHGGRGCVAAGNDACVMSVRLKRRLVDRRLKTYRRFDSAQSSGVVKPWPVSGSRAVKR